MRPLALQQRLWHFHVEHLEQLGQFPVQLDADSRDLGDPEAPELGARLVSGEPSDPVTPTEEAGIRTSVVHGVSSRQGRGS